MTDLSDRAAKIIKIVTLARHPMMDHVAVKLACEPTYDEKQRAREWEAAFRIAGTDLQITVESLSEVWAHPETKP